MMMFDSGLFAWLKNKKFIFWSVVFLTIIGAFLRFWNLENSQQFLGDQGRDSLVVSKIFTQHDLVFTGPVTSIGNMYLGPAYYYFMLPFLWLSYPSPMGPIFAMALLGVVTIPALYRIGSEILNERAALIAAFFYTFAPAAITFTRFSWNPNPAPIVMLFMIWGIYRAITKNSWYWLLAFAMMSLIIQLHYVALLAGGTLGLFWLFELIKSLKARKLPKYFVISSVSSFALLLSSIIPLILFDWRHNWLNFKAFQNIFIKEEAFSALSPSFYDTIRTYFLELIDRSHLVFYDIWFGSNSIRNPLLILMLLIALVLVVIKLWYKSGTSLKSKYRSLIGSHILLITALISIIGLAFYQHEIYIHYVTFLFPISFLILGMIFDKLLSTHVVVASVIIMIFTQFYAHQVVAQLSFQDVGTPISIINQTAQQIVDELDEEESYSIALLSGTKDILGQNYLYFLHTTGRPPVEEVRRGFNDVLFIIDEEKIDRNVIELPIYEIAVFNNRRIDKVIEIPNGPTVTVVRRDKDVE
jgi:hypothetical protein